MLKNIKHIKSTSRKFNDVFWQICWKTSTSVVGDIVEGIVQMTIQV